LKKLTQSFYFALLVLLITIACYGFKVEIMEKEKKEEVHGVIQEKFQNLIVTNKLSYYETEMQYWVKLHNGTKVQLPAYLYKDVSKGEEMSFVKVNGGTIYLSKNVYPRE
jgi:hypothetical protein